MSYLACVIMEPRLDQQCSKILTLPRCRSSQRSRQWRVEFCANACKQHSPQCISKTHSRSFCLAPPSSCRLHAIKGHPSSAADNPKCFLRKLSLDEARSQHLTRREPSPIFELISRTALECEMLNPICTVQMDMISTAETPVSFDATALVTTRDSSVDCDRQG
jgi:hypothetical protein